MSLFNINRSSPHRSVGVLTSPVAAALRGQAFQESAVAGVAELADGLKPLSGFVTRDIVVGGPVLGDHIYPGRLELPFTAGQEISCEKADEVEVEGTDYLTAITTGTALESDLSFTAGKWVVKGGSQKVFGRLKEIMTPEVIGNVRIRIEMVNYSG